LHNALSYALQKSGSVSSGKSDETGCDACSTVGVSDCGRCLR
jgi:hypothetical protein